MIDDHYVLAIIPARGGSKSVPRKNLIPVAGKSLIERTMIQAAPSAFIDRVILSTDDVPIAVEGKRVGIDVPFMRPDALATDEATTASVVHHVLERLEMTTGYLVLLQPTSPMRSSDDIDHCIRLCHESRAKACVSVMEIDKSPYWMFKTGDTGYLEPFIDTPERPSRRQDAPKTYMLNGAIYVVAIDSFLSENSFLPEKTMSYVMPAERSIDIDTPSDLARVEKILNEKQ